MNLSRTGNYQKYYQDQVIPDENKSKTTNMSMINDNSNILSLLYQCHFSQSS